MELTVVGLRPRTTTIGLQTENNSGGIRRTTTVVAM